MYTTCSELVVFMYWTGKSMNNILSYCGLVDPRISASDKDLPVIMDSWQYYKGSKWFLGPPKDQKNSLIIGSLCSAIKYKGKTLLGVLFRKLPCELKLDLSVHQQRLDWFGLRGCNIAGHPVHRASLSRYCPCWNRHRQKLVEFWNRKIEIRILACTKLKQTF